MRYDIVLLDGAGLNGTWDKGDGDQSCTSTLQDIHPRMYTCWRDEEEVVWIDKERGKSMDAFRCFGIDCLPRVV